MRVISCWRPNSRVSILLSVSVAVICLLSESRSCPGASLLSGPGDLAGRATGAAAWGILHPGDDIPESTSLRTSAAGFVKIQLEEPQALEEVVLMLDAATGLESRFSEHEFTLVWGRMRFSSTAPKASWKIHSAEAGITISGQAVLHLDRDGDALTLNLLEGNALLSLAGTETQLTAPMHLVLKGQEIKVQRTPEGKDRWVAAVEQWLVPAAVQGPGQLVVHDQQTNAFKRLEIDRYHVHVVMQPPVALVQIDQSFFNPTGQRQEGTYVFNLPPGASVSRFAMFVDRSTLVEGELIERQRASSIYTSIVRGQRDPAILEQLGDNLFRMRVFPIFAHDSKRILLDFTVPLVEENREYFFQLPLMSDLQPIRDFQLSGTIAGPVEKRSVRSFTHPELPFRYKLNGVCEFKEQRFTEQPPDSFQLKFRRPVRTQPSAESYIVNRLNGGQKYFVATIPEPALPTEPQRQPPNDVLILVDTSGSSQISLDQSRQAVQTIVANLPLEDRFQIACADLELRRISRDWTSPHTSAARAALDTLDLEFAQGPSHLQTAFAYAGQLFLDSDTKTRRQQLIYLGDGIGTGSSAESQWIEILKPAPGDSQRVIFSAVSPVNQNNDSSMLKQGVSLTGGRYFTTAHLSSLMTWVLSGLPAPLSVDRVELLESPQAELFTAPYQTAGQALYIYGKCLDQAALKLAVTVAGQRREYTIPEEVGDNSQAVFTGRLWAQRKLEQLISGNFKLNHPDRNEIIALSQEWSLMSPLTAFLVLENENDYVRWKIDRKLRHQYWKPAEALVAVPLDDRRPQLIQDSDADGVNQGPFPIYKLTKAQFDFQIQQIEKLLQANSPDLAMQKLLLLELLPEQQGVEQVKRLKDQALGQLRMALAIRDLGGSRPLFDRSTPSSFPALNLTNLSLGVGEISPDYLHRHPLAVQMMRHFDLPVSIMTLKEFVAFVRSRTGLNVFLNNRSLEQESLSGNEEINFTGLNGITLRNLLYHSLQDVGGVSLTALESPYTLEITSVADADERLETRLYPVVDLVRTDHLPDPIQLVNPYVDTDRAFFERAQKALQKKVTVNFHENTVLDVAGWLQRELQLPVRVDRKALEDESLTGEEKTRVWDFEEVPAEFVMRTVLSDIQRVTLKMIPDREVIRITSKAVDEEHFTLRVYSGAGIVYDEPAERKIHKNPFINYYGMGWPGMGWPGMSGWGMMGGMGGGFGGGMGGMGGGFGGGMGMGGGNPGSTSPTVPATDPGISVPGLSVIGPPQKSETTPDQPAGEPADRNDSDPVHMEEEEPEFFAQISTLLKGSGIPASVDEVLYSIQNNIRTTWFMVDGEGGDLSYSHHAMAFIVRQTTGAQEEIGQLLRALQQAPAAGRRVFPARMPVFSEEDLQGWDFSDLIQGLHLSTASPWLDLDGEGGTITVHPPTMSLIITQTQAAHEDVENILVQLRRVMLQNRYLEAQPELARSLTPAAMSLLESPLVHWPPQPAPKAVGTPEELKLLQVRKIPERFSETWKVTNTSQRPDSTPQRTFQIRKNGLRMELLTDTWQLRCDGEFGALTDPQLTKVEIDRWGENIRQVISDTFPWMPHFSNTQLAQHFAIRLHDQQGEQTTLDWIDRNHPDAVMRITFDRQHQVPVASQLLVKGALQYQLAFEQNAAGEIVLVTARSPEGKLLEEWKRIGQSAEVDIPAVDEHPPRDLLVRHDAILSPFLRIDAALRKFDYPMAATLLSQQLEQQPDQPLLNFLLARVCEYQANLIPNQKVRQREAIERVVRSQANSLIQMLVKTPFQQLDDLDLFAILNSIPPERQGLGTRDALTQYYVKAGQLAPALQELEAALSLPDGQTESRQLQKIELLLKTGKSEPARQAAEQMIHNQANSHLLAALGNLFLNEKQLNSARDLFTLALGQTSDKYELSTLYARRARCLTGIERWNDLLAAAEANPGRMPEENPFLETLLSETQTEADQASLKELEAAARNPTIKLALKIRQIELMRVNAAAAQLCLELLESNQMPIRKKPWAYQRMISGGQSQTLIQILEDKLRRHQELDTFERQGLIKAYRTLNRPQDARRIELNKAG